MRKNLKEARQKAGMTQKQVAEYLGISDKAYQQIEYGIILGKIKHWDKLEDLFGVNQRTLRYLSSGQNVRQDNQ
ncbi:MAG: helix-turn-helix transcriptional regulator [Lachnospiraceae bacterium]|nr:helix-turn-helix transcriptional regulator [Lachnospiraceae bacterium]